jgi:hypothetical protein
LLGPEPFYLHEDLSTLFIDLQQAIEIEIRPLFAASFPHLTWMFPDKSDI